MTRVEMATLINAGTPVLFAGKRYTVAADLPTQEEIDAIYNPVVISNLPKSAYDIAVDNGFVGTQVEWLASLKGEDGEGGGSAGFYTSTGIAGYTNPNGGETSIIPAGSGSLTIPANTLTVGKRLVGKMEGTMDGTYGGNVLIKIKLGGTNTKAFYIYAGSGVATNGLWSMEFTLLSTGDGENIKTRGTMIIPADSATFAMTFANTTTIDVTTDKVLDVTVTPYENTPLFQCHSASFQIL